MTLFDASKLASDSISAEQIDLANDGVEKLRGRLVAEIHTHIIPDWFVRSQSKVFFQGHVRRALTLIEGGYDEYLSDRSLISFMCVRGIYETVACVFDFCDNLLLLLEEGDFEKTGKFIHTRLFSTRHKDLLDEDDDDFDYTATNILKQIDRFSKHVANSREEYDYFSELLHPNSLGAHLHFSDEEEIDEHQALVKFSKQRETHDVERWLVKAGCLLSLMNIAIGVTEERLSAHTFLKPS